MDVEIMRQLAALVGWKQIRDISGVLVWRTPDKLLISSETWKPLDSMDDAMLIVRTLQAQGWEYALGSRGADDYAYFSRPVAEDWPRAATAIARGLARAICEAALKTRGGA